MARKKSTRKLFHVRLARPDLLTTIKRRMLNTVDQHGRGLAPDIALTHGNVIDFGLFMASIATEPDVLVIQRSRFLNEMAEAVDTLAEMAPKARREYLDYMVVKASEAGRVPNDAKVSDLPDPLTA